MSDYKIQGETGRPLAASQVDLDQTTYSGMTLTRNNQAADTLTFFVASTARTTDPDYLPAFGQQISLFKNNTRIFLGYVSRPKFILQGGIFGWQIEASHGWPELDRVALTTGDAEYARPQGSLTATVTDIITKAIAGGARISQGTIDAMFDIPAIAFRGNTCGSALAELLRICPDTVVYFTYNDGAWPAINIRRRANLTAKTFTFGTSELVEPFTCSPIPDVTPARVTVAFATRNNNGIVTETIQTAGSGTPTQSVILTGSNFTDFQTQAAAGQVTVQTSSSASWAVAYAADPKLAAIAGIPTPDGIGFLTYAIGPVTSKSLTTWTRVPLSSVSTSPHTHMLIAGRYAEWMAKLGITAGSSTISGSFFWKWRYTVNGTPQSEPAWLTQLIAAGAVEAANSGSSWWTNNNGVGSPFSPNYPEHDKAVILSYDVSITVPAISRSIPTATALRDPGDYGTTSPPSTLATNLLAAQNFVPYEGQFGLSPYESPTDLLASQINFAGLTARLSNIGAMVQSETTDILTGAKSIQLGLAARQGDTALTRLRVLRS